MMSACQPATRRMQTHVKRRSSAGGRQKPSPGSCKSRFGACGKVRHRNEHMLRAFNPATQRAEETAEQSYWAGEDFYTIMGIYPTASFKEIRRAYYDLMRDFHPDLSTNFDSTELCTLLNEIYGTLMDPEKRALYDAIAGFSLDSVNPFQDTSYPRDQVFVDEVSCIGCGKCAMHCPKTFQMEGSMYRRARVMKQDADTEEEIQIAMETCPVDCIHWVTAPQLSVLEAALSKMDRVSVWVMMRSSSVYTGNVFEEARRAWGKRRAEMATRLEAAGTTAFTMWGQVEDPSLREGGPGGGPPRDKMGRAIADLAASAARAARMWKYAQQSRIVGSLSD